MDYQERLQTFLYITDVQLEVGPTATDYEYRDIATELAMAQRYFLLLTTVGWAATSTGKAGQAVHIGFPAEMRTIPSLTQSNFVDIDSSGLTISSANILKTHVRRFIMNSSETAGNRYTVDFALDAEL